MKISRSKTATLITMFLTLTIAVTMVALPVANAHTPPWTVPTWMYVTVSPNPVGVDQTVVVVWWNDKTPPTAEGTYGDRWEGVTVEVTKPDGTKQTFGPYTSDPVGGSWFTYTPETVGTYYFQAFFPGQKIAGRNPPPGGYVSAFPDTVNDTYQASTSEKVALIVQQEPLKSFQGPPLPTDYWTRPINAMNREWSQIAGNWLSGGYPIGNFNPYTTAPESPHIVWTKPLDLGGIVGGSFGDLSYRTSSGYETMWGPPIIVQGRLYYNTANAPRYGYTCVDLRTGEEIWYRNSTGPVLIGSQTPAHIGATNIPWEYPRLSFGQIYDYESPNQHGVRAYLWSTYSGAPATTFNYTMQNGTTYSFTASAGSTVWQMFDAFTGNWICNIANVPSGTRVMGPSGEILIYTYNSANGWLALWNSSVALGYPNNNLRALVPGEAFYWMWREPLGRTVDGRNGYSWNVTTPKQLGSINTVLADRIIGTSGLVGFQYGTSSYSVWALSLKPNQVGTLMWRQDYAAAPVPNATVVIGPSSLADGVYIAMVKETTQWLGYSLDTGEKLWGPTPSQAGMDMYSMRSAGAGAIAYGKLLSAGWSGIVYCYDVKKGTLLWNYSLGTCGLESAYVNWPVGSGAGFSIADHKIYVTTGEHSHTQPLYRDWSIYCIDTETGKGLWNMTGLMPVIAIADGYAVALDSMDNQIYCYGKGDTATTVSTSPKVSVHGSSVLIEGTVTDQSAGAKGTPAIADESMRPWMDYLYKQQSIPGNAKGVEVSLDTIDPNGNFVHIGTATSDMSGMFKKMFIPEVPGEYTIIATFAGSKSYWPSYAETAIGVEETPPATAAPEYPQPIDPTMTIIGVGIAIMILVTVFGLLMLRKK